jgi:thioredoxin-related protein
MRAIKSISIIIFLFLISVGYMSCGRGKASDENLHRSPNQQGAVPEKITLKSPHQLYDPKKEEYKSEYIKGTHKPTRLLWAGSIEQALQMTGEKSKKKTIVYFASEKPCEECRYIEEKIFTDARVLKYSDRWIFVRVDVDLQPDLAKYHHIDSVPAFKFLDHMGHAYRTQTGLVTPEQFAEMLLTWF